MDIHYVKQEHPMGCGCAVLAMLTNQTYGEIASYFENPYGPNQTTLNLNLCSPQNSEMDAYLAGYGFYVKRFYSPDYSVNSTVQFWPSEEAIAFCNVRVRGAICNHWVVLLPDGTIIDPDSESRTRLDEFETINSVAYIRRTP